MDIPKLAAFAGRFPKIWRVGSNFCRKIRGSSMPTIDASSTATGTALSGRRGEGKMINIIVESRDQEWCRQV